MKKIDFTKGSGEFVAFAIICPFICIIVIIMCAYIQLFASIHQITNALNVCGRSAAICTSREDAEKQALMVANAAITSPNIDNIEISVEFVNDSDDWINGVLLYITLSADIKTLEPYITTGRRSKKTIVVIENSPISSGDINTLAAILATESNVTDYQGMLAVGTVVMNRVDSNAYPNTISDVIYAGNGTQFAAILNPRFQQYIATGAPEAALTCASDILKGQRTPELMAHSCTQFRTHKYTDGTGRFIDSSIYHPHGIDIGGNWFFW